MIEFIQNNWVAIVAILVAVNTALKGIRDAIDSTPETDDNLFERIVTIIGKTVAYITTGKRPEL